MEELLSPEVCNDLIAEQARPVHFAFGLCVPVKLPTTGNSCRSQTVTRPEGTRTPYTGQLAVDDPTDRP